MAPFGLNPFGLSPEDVWRLQNQATNQPYTNYGNAPFGQSPSEDSGEDSGEDSSEESGGSAIVTRLTRTGHNPSMSYGNPMAQNQSSLQQQRRQPQKANAAPAIAPTSASAPALAPAPTPAPQMVRTSQVPFGIQNINVAIFATNPPAGPQCASDEVYLFPPTDDTKTIEVRFESTAGFQATYPKVRIPPMPVASFKQSITGQAADRVKVHLKWTKGKAKPRSRELSRGDNIVKENAEILGELTVGKNDRSCLVVGVK